LSVFLDEASAQFPNDPRARFLKATSRSLAAFLDEHAPLLPLDPLHGHAVIHGHCHEKALSTMDAERRMLMRAGLDVTVLSSGCCGMAGSFGFERDKYDVSMAIADGDLFEKLRAEDASTVVVADGFSCREQIEQGGLERHALHSAEVLRLALRRDDEEHRPSPG
jgi:Fe-S oxidoreductase